ncbi:hypothetical protein F6Q07_21555 [Pectobacterium parmentieri]|uniref:hypothetical protein n=1 Tax=Pectobacterium parmentieri TaxID=1905730 RepID=UPI000EAD1896|nr:hypothetical protein [Pectobacterium parmentieri]AYG99617.1 hypothetical protein C5E26_00745 [Pectobacterium parmentieri]AYH25856.1 hypothetical protein C5E20_00950 [Pectobacterium parmentieri]AYH30310.1 hypothetical protein C5E19_00740 [Pectobacterium parmentieri]MBI0520683.1 hypothetical protein [Pectobacterium parmentieri]
MRFLLRNIKFPWVMESVSEPFFSYSGVCLNVRFLVFLGMDGRKKDIDSYLKLNKLNDESDMPDEVYNNAGYRMADFEFKFFDLFFCTDKASGLSNYTNGSDLHAGVYEEIDENNESLGYVFIGNDLFLSVKAKTYVASIDNNL